MDQRMVDWWGKSWADRTDARMAALMETLRVVQLAMRLDFLMADRWAVLTTALWDNQMVDD